MIFQICTASRQVKFCASLMLPFFLASCATPNTPPRVNMIVQRTSPDPDSNSCDISVKVGNHSGEAWTGIYYLMVFRNSQNIVVDQIENRTARYIEPGRAITEGWKLERTSCAKINKISLISFAYNASPKGYVVELDPSQVRTTLK